MTDPGTKPLTAVEATAEVLDAQEARHPMALVVGVSGSPELVGARVVVRQAKGGAKSLVGSFGDAVLDDGALALGTQRLEEHRASTKGLYELKSASGSTVQVYVEVHYPQPDLVIVGAGHIAQPLCSMGALMGFRVIVVDDRPDFATRERFPEAERIVRVDFMDPFADIPIHSTSHIVLVTRGHKYDFECLRHLLKTEVEPPYVGMIGSRRRIRAAFSQLQGEGMPKDRLSRVRAPVGLDIGAETPVEIAVAVAAEIVLQWRGGTGVPLAEQERILERFFKESEL
ncbi:MAG: XdhC family protein [Gemmatimonadota bacterium]|nr:XdhC family protein [Gemmatimonadota bacterium]MEC7846084.1 XdhC family protein [Gemmatimonadota bacterium]